MFLLSDRVRNLKLQAGHEWGGKGGAYLTVLYLEENGLEGDNVDAKQKGECKMSV